MLSSQYRQFLIMSRDKRSRMLVLLRVSMFEKLSVIRLLQAYLSVTIKSRPNKMINKMYSSLIWMIANWKCLLWKLIAMWLKSKLFEGLTLESIISEKSLCNMQLINSNWKQEKTVQKISKLWLNCSLNVDLWYRSLLGMMNMSLMLTNFMKVKP